MSVFEADPEGFREQNAGRPAAHLIREAIQNVFDEAATRLEVEITYEAPGVRFVIVDDVPGGIRDEQLIYTIWKSDKTDSPQKRGRMGRGLKELISISDETLIVTAGTSAVQFTRSRGRWERSSPRKRRPEAGTSIEGFTRLWKKRDVDAVIEYLMKMREPAGLRFVVNGIEVRHAAATERYTLKLPTVLFEVTDDGSRVQREPRRDTLVVLIPEKSPWVYEMGIPIEPIDCPLSIDVGQRVPLREKRDVLTESYRRELFAKLLDARVRAGLVPAEVMRDNHVLIASRAPEHLSLETKAAIVEAHTGGLPYATTPADAKAATGMHISVAPLRQLPESVRELAREVGTNVRSVMDDLRAAACRHIDPGQWTDEQGRLVRTWEWIAAGIRRSCQIVLVAGQPSAAASFNQEERVLSIYVEKCRDIFHAPLSAPALKILIHELAHWKSYDNEHGFDFHSDAESVGAAVAAFLLEHAEEARERIV